MGGGGPERNPGVLLLRLKKSLDSTCFPAVITYVFVFLGLHSFEDWGELPELSCSLKHKNIKRVNFMTI